MSRPTIPEVLDRFVAYHADHGAWGSLHIVLDDHNVDDHSVEFCIQWAQNHQDSEGELLGRILLRMSKTQRLKLPEKVFTAERTA